MLYKRWATVAGIVMAVAALLLSAGLTLAQDGQPPIQPSDVESQDVTPLWNQMGPVADNGQGVVSYNNSVGQALAADDFVVTDTTAPTEYTAWILSQVVVRGIADFLFPGSNEKATLCFYNETAGHLPLASPFSCYSGLTASNPVTEPSSFNFIYYVLTYTISGSPLFWTDTHYWLSVSMSTPPLGYWSWRARSDPNPYSNTITTTQPFGFQISPGFLSGNFHNSACQGQWQLQTKTSYCADPLDLIWPRGQDLSFKLIGSKFFGHLTPRVYLPAMRR